MERFPACPSDLKELLSDLLPHPDAPLEESEFSLQASLLHFQFLQHFVIDVEKHGKLVKPRVVSNEIKSVSYPPLQEIAERIM